MLCSLYDPSYETNAFQGLRLTRAIYGVNDSDWCKTQLKDK